MATISYTKTQFRTPNRIDEASYSTLKHKLSQNPNFEIDPNPETFSQNFKGILTTIKITVGYIIFYLIFFGSKSESQVPGVLNLFAGLSFLATIFAVIMLLLEGPSYATYLKEKNAYFQKMKFALKNTKNYSEFCVSFYGR